MPLNNTPKLTAAERRAALIAERDALAAHLETVKAARDALSPSDPAWRRKAAEMRDVAEELDGYAAAIAALAPEVEAETREAHHSARVAQHARAMTAASDADAIPARMDRIMSELCRLVPAYLEWAGRCASAGGVEPHPYRLGETVPNIDHVRDVFLARLVAAGILDTEFMPQHIVDAPAAFNDARIAGATWPGQAPPDPMQMAASASFSAIHAGFKRALASAAPDRQRREVEHLNEMARQRAAREAAELSKPLPKLPAPPPAVHTVAPVVIGR
ncbi:hypothetical protein J5Y09_05215 [Roseomonas sp. PWR1]|uniref:Uncharacterized protein n=1 Tax=Roseomonas nitratireducens TaxID=2820810 RepID=A0ABS4AR40_9PROT|nr:hypothetical protein [Neoroseomonas nitratireducens]MBP0463301.1 hypothetical protein [Neoroseomonas nitratireducens]